MKNKKIEEDENVVEEIEEAQEAIEELTEEQKEEQGEGEESAGEIRGEEIMTKEEEYLLGWKRCQADFENFKKRQAESQKDLLRYSTQSIILQVLPVIDNFQASTAHIPEDQKENPWVTGIMYIQKQLEQVLTDNGVQECGVKVGDSFDPAKHEAIENKECSCEKEFKNKIKQVVMRGYMTEGKVIRPARVVVE